MKQRDLMILTQLRKNARESLTNMSRKTKIPVSTIYEKIKGRNNGIVTKFTSILDFTKLGYSTRANIMLKVNKQSKKDMREYLLKHPNVNSLYKINNGYDYLVEGVFRHLKELEDFLEAAEERFDITQTQVHYIIDDLKRETFLSDPDLLPMHNF